MFAGEEPYNCSKRGTVIVDKDGKISFYEEVPMKEPRSVDDLAEAVDEAFEQRANEYGEGGASR